MHPTTATVRELGHHITKGHLLSPDGFFGFLLGFFDVSREDATLEVGGSYANEAVVRVPVNTSHSGANRLPDVLANPPILEQWILPVELIVDNYRNLLIFRY